MQSAVSDIPGKFPCPAVKTGGHLYMVLVYSIRKEIRVVKWFQGSCPKRVSRALLRLLFTLFAAWPFTTHLMPKALADTAKTELMYDSASKTWLKRPAGKVRKNAETKWANVSPIAAVVVSFDESAQAGSIIIRTGERRLYFVERKGVAKRYGIGVGREGFAWKGTQKITRKAEWPSWTPPAEMRVREAKKGRVLPDRMDGGPDNPLGARALYLGDTAYRIHGTNEPWTIGEAVSSGCIRMANEDIVELYSKIKIGNLVIVE